MKVFRAIGKSLCYFMFYMMVQSVITIALFLVKLPALLSTGIFDVFADESIDITQADIDTMINGIYDAVSEIIVPTLIISAIITIGGFFLAAWFTKQNVFRQVRLNAVKPLSLLPIIPLGIGAQFTVGLVMGLLEKVPFLTPMFQTYNSSSSILDIDTTFFSVLAIGVIGPVLEEILFRGYIYGTFKVAVKRGVAIAISAIVFGVAHGTFLWALYAAALGVLLVLLFEKFDSLWAPILLHVTFNTSSFLAEALSGVPFIVITIVNVCSVFAVIASIVYIWHKKAPELEPRETGIA